MAGKKPTAADAEIVFRLYEMRREPEMRKARHFINFQLKPESADDVIRVATAMGTQENAWSRQVMSYWSQAAALVLRGVVEPGLFFDWNGEMIFVFNKFRPFLKEVRERMNNPDFLGTVEKAINSHPEAKKRLEGMSKRMAAMMAAGAAVAKN